MKHAAEIAWPYSERNSVGVDGVVEQLMDVPERPLGEAEKAEALVFSQDLFNGIYGEKSCTAGRTLGEVNQLSYLPTVQKFYLDYFCAPEGTIDGEALGMSANATREEISSRLLDVDRVTTTMTAGQRRAIAGRSAKWYQQQLEAALASDDTTVEESETLTVNYRPDALLEKAAAVQAYRHFYREVSRDLRLEETSDLRDAKLMLTDLHLARMNNMLAHSYPYAIELARQLEQMPRSADTARWEAQLYEVAPILISVHQEEEQVRQQRLDSMKQRLAPRLDYIRNGVGTDTAGSISSIAKETLRHAETLSTQRDGESTPHVPTKMVEAMQSQRWDGNQLKDFLESCLEEMGLLSDQESTYDEVADRNGAAADGKWQVVRSTDSKSSSLSVESPKRVMVIPMRYDRPLVSDIEKPALSTAAHELTHVLQAEHDKQLAQNLPLAALKGRRSRTIKEMGGIVFERELQAMVGHGRPTNLHYLRALQAKLDGGSRLAVARAYYESSTAAGRYDEDSLHKRRQVAVSSTERLYRYGGYDSEPLDYLEQDILAAALGGRGDEITRTVAVAASAFSLHDYAALHRFDLWNLPSRPEVNPAKLVLDGFTRRHYSRKA